jgi:hypothetical protein
LARRVMRRSTWTRHPRCCCQMDAMPGRVCATRRAHRTQGSDSTGRYLTMAAYRAGPGRFPRCMSCTIGRLVLPGRQPAAVRTVGSSAPRCPTAPAAETGRSERTTIESRVHFQIKPPSREASRAIDVQLKAAAGDVPDSLEWKRAEHALDLGRGQSPIIRLH